MAGLTSLFGLDPDTYLPHAVHGPGRSYGETNCYTDIVVELLHARGDEPLAMLAHLVRQDFEGDQFTFFKPPPGDIEALFGVDIHEMNPWRALTDQIAEQLAAGRTLIVELDAFHLPDLASTDYGTNHVKTSVVVEAIDRGDRRLVYWHNAGLYALAGTDYSGIFRLDTESDPAMLPPYVELVRFDAGERLDGERLRAAARAQLSHHLARRPQTNPFARFGERLKDDLPALVDGDAARFHAYAFPTVRMAGSGFELLADHARWQFGDDAAAATAALGEVVEACKVLSFRLARRRAFDPAEQIERAALNWDAAMAELAALAP